MRYPASTGRPRRYCDTRCRTESEEAIQATGQALHNVLLDPGLGLALARRPPAAWSKLEGAGGIYGWKQAFSELEFFFPDRIPVDVY